MTTLKARFIHCIIFAILCIPQIITEFFSFATNRRINGYLLFINAILCLAAVIAVEAAKALKSK